MTVNRVPRRLSVDPEKPLLWVLRDELKLKGTKYGCGVGVCGICTVHLDGQAVRSCRVSAREADGGAVTTIEGVVERGDPIVHAWIAEQVPQCGYCQPGQIMAATALLAAHPTPSDAALAQALDGVLCRCGTYRRIRRALRDAGKTASAPAYAVPPSCMTGVPANAIFAPNPWLRIDADGVVTLLIDRSEMGQGVVTGLAALIAEELEVELAQLRIAFAPVGDAYANPRLGGQMTGGSTSVRAAWQPLREAGAQARTILVEAAAAAWDVSTNECYAHAGRVVHRPSGRRLTYGALAAAAKSRRPPRKKPLLKPATDFRLIGKSIPRLEVPDLACGRAVFGGDVMLPGMSVALLARSPVFGGKLARFDSTGARAVPGVRSVVEVGDAVAVLADDFWSAERGRSALAVEWTPGENAILSDELIRRRYAELVERKGKTVRHEGNAARALKTAARVIEATYATPFLAHATMEPMNCTARVGGGRCEIWVPTQAQSGARETAMAITGLPARAIEVHTTFLGGGFGRRQEQDFVAEAVTLAQRTGAPVQVLWTRADDLQHDYYRPAHRARLAAGLDAAGLPIAWHHRIVGPALVMNGVDMPYAIPNVREEQVTEETGVPVGAWRSVGASQNAYASECFVDELAQAAGRDPLDYRRALLADAPRHRRVLDLAAAMADWGHAAAGRHQGVALYRSFGTWVAQVAEVSLDAGAIRVHRVVCAVDCGTVVHPDLAQAQMEGAVAFALSAALYGAIHIEHGAVRAASFEDYPIVRLSEMPEVEVRFVPSSAPPGGIGEPGVPPLAPAVANAVFAATGQPQRCLPLAPTSMA